LRSCIAIAITLPMGQADEHEAALTGMPERRTEPRDDLTGWERAPFACGCGRGCTSWKGHHANVARADSDADAIVAMLLADDLRAAGAR
jgi:hypothetical protein